MSMRALVRDELGVALRRVPVPVLAHDDDVIVEVAVAGVCRTDLAVADGTLGKSPIVLGHELAGVVIAGAVPVGTRVTVIPFSEEGWLGVHRDGGFAERVRVSRACVRALPDELTFELGAYVEPVAAALGAIAWIPSGARVKIGGEGRIAELTARVVRAHGGEVVDGACEVAIETDGVLAPLVDALEPGGTLIVKSRRPRAVPLDLDEARARGVVVRGVGHGSFDTAIAWLAYGTLEVGDLLAPPRPLDDHEAVLGDARASESQKQMFAPGAA